MKTPNKVKKLKVGVVGAGRATRELTIPAFNCLSDAELIAICDVDLETAKGLVKPLKISAYSGLSEMLDKEDLQVVIINTPVQTHTDLAIEAMRKGCSVIIEKPVVARLEELEKLRQARDETGMKLTAVHNYKFYQGPQKAFQMYQNGLLGEIIHIDRIWMTPPQEDRMERNSKGWWHRSVGGRLADALPHMLYLPYMFVGPMELVAVTVRKLAKDRPWSFCDESNIVLRTPKAYVNIRQSTNQESWPYKGYIYHTFIYGTKLSAATNHHDAEIIWKHSNLRDFLRGTKSGMSLFKSQLVKIIPGLVKIIPEKKRKVVSRGAHNVLYEKFIDYILEKGPNPVPWEEIVNVATLTEQISAKMQECIDKNKKVICE